MTALCTNCRSPILPVVAVDIDGTLGDFHQHFIRFLEGYLGWEDDSVEMYRGQQAMHEWAEAEYGISYRTWQDIKLAYRQGAQKRTMPVYDGAADLTHRLKMAGCEIWMTTTRPYLRLDNIDPDTRFWLARNDIVYDYMLYDEDKYHKLRERVGKRVVGVLDDLSDQCYTAVGLWGPDAVFQRMTRWNVGSAYGGWERVDNLGDAADWLVARAQRFRYSSDIRQLGAVDGG